MRRSGLASEYEVFVGDNADFYILTDYSIVYAYLIEHDTCPLIRV